MTDSPPDAPPHPTASSGRLAALRARHPAMIYRGYRWRMSPDDSLVITYDIELEPAILFQPRVEIRNLPRPADEIVPREELENFVFHLGLMELPSYWKAACPPRVDVVPRMLEAEQCRWWQELFAEGMSEFFYVNGISRDEAAVTVSSAPQAAPIYRPPAPSPSAERALLPVGGGKDSVVSLELARARCVPTTCFVLNTIPSAVAVIRTSGLTGTVQASRQIDPQLLRMNASGYLNGHTPFSAYLAFLSVFCARLFGCSAAVLSNERSADEPNTFVDGLPVNHQYSKSLEFERRFRGYCSRYLTSDVQYFSLLRPLYEIQIARLFAQHPRYLPAFKSCNRGISANAWCGACPKCLFAFIILAPFVEPAALREAFGGNLLDHSELLDCARELVGLSPVKPFECVGTREESLAALFLASPHFKRPDGTLPTLLRRIADDCPIPPEELRALAVRLLEGWSTDHEVPESWAAGLRAALGPAAGKTVLPTAWGEL